MAVSLFVVACSSDDSAPSWSPVVLTRGPIPSSARLADGTIDMSQVPDFIPALSGDGTAGWIARRDVFPAECEHMPPMITVFAGDLQTVVGHMYPGVGFVPLGREEEMLPPPGRDRDLTIRMRNDWGRPAIVEVIKPPDAVEGRPPARIAPSIVLDAGEERDVRIRAPANRWALRLRNGDGGFLYSDDLGRRTRELESAASSAVSVAITSEGSLSLVTEQR
ncbi:MAG: hypothetical protein M3295_02720 [Chloroflexota bacterium]|nr:hypothetical protein [Chloroflexota bacterium]